MPCSATPSRAACSSFDEAGSRSSTGPDSRLEQARRHGEHRALAPRGRSAKAVGMPICPKCGQGNPEIARFCFVCATPLAAVPAQREERKVVTVVFADLVGFTSRADGMDPEDVQALLSPYHARLRAELERFGGTVEKFIGDAVMALFGAPVAREGDPERAVRAALAIRDWVRGEEEELQLRI